MRCQCASFVFDILKRFAVNFDTDFSLTTRFVTLYQMRRHFEAVPDDIGKAVRLGFHHCVGGCDGCIALDSDLNRGLKEYILEQGWITARKLVDTLLILATCGPLFCPAMY